MIECLSLIEHAIPQIALISFCVAKEFAAGTKSLQTVKNAIIGCWSELQDSGQTDRTELPEVASIRAVLFLLIRLREGQFRDFLDSLSLFLDFVNRVEPHREEILQLLVKHFGYYLEPSARSLLPYE